MVAAHCYEKVTTGQEDDRVFLITTCNSCNSHAAHGSKRYNRYFKCRRRAPILYLGTNKGDYDHERNRPSRKKNEYSIIAKVNSPRRCSICGKMDHDKRTCPTLVNSQRCCSICGKTGHDKRNCPKAKSPPKKKKSPPKKAAGRGRGRGKKGGRGK